MKKCTKCYKLKSPEEFTKDKKTKDGLNHQCKACHKLYREKHKEEIAESKKSNYIEHKKDIREKHKKYYQENKEDRIKKHKKYYHTGGGREKRGSQSMYENKNCASYLGVVIGERFCKHLFKDVEMMPFNNIGFDIICNHGMKIDVKTSTIHKVQLKNSMVNRWTFSIKLNKICDYFILIALDNIDDLNKLHMWLIPGSEINNKTSVTISSTTINKWDQWKIKAIRQSK